MSDPIVRLPYRYQTIQLEAVSSQDLRSAADFYDPIEDRVMPLDLSANPLAKYFAFNRNPGPLRRVLNCVTSRWGAFALSEWPYLDMEFWDSHAGFYEHGFRRFPVACERYHFFSPLLSQEDEKRERKLLSEEQRELELKRAGSLVADLLSGRSNLDSLKNFHYHGYCVLRPKDAFAVGRVAVAFDERPADVLQQPAQFNLIPYEIGGYPFLETGYTVNATLMNARLNVQTVEFIQQDPNVGMCGTASLWVATRITARSHGMNKYTYSTITKQAERGWSPERQIEAGHDPIGVQEGLFPEQIRNALAATGANSLVVSSGEGMGRAEMLHEVYSACESGLPVILCFTKDPAGTREGHAVTLVGHNLPSWRVFSGEGIEFTEEFPQPVFESVAAWKTLRDQLTAAKANPAKHYLLSQAIRVYYAHDDAFGPYNRITFVDLGDGDPNWPVRSRLSKVRKLLGGKGDVNTDWTVLQRGGRVKPETNYLQHAIIPTPQSVRLRASDPLPHLIPFFETYFPGLDDAAYLWRGFLATGADFKASLHDRGYGEGVRQWYASLHLPQYVWVYEASWVDKGDFAPCFACGPEAATSKRLFTASFCLMPRVRGKRCATRSSAHACWVSAGTIGSSSRRSMSRAASRGPARCLSVPKHAQGRDGSHTLSVRPLRRRELSMRPPRSRDETVGCAEFLPSGCRCRVSPDRRWHEDHLSYAVGVTARPTRLDLALRCNDFSGSFGPHPCVDSDSCDTPRHGDLHVTMERTTCTRLLSCGLHESSWAVPLAAAAIVTAYRPDRRCPKHRSWLGILCAWRLRENDHDDDGSDTGLRRYGPRGLSSLGRAVRARSCASAPVRGCSRPPCAVPRHWTTNLRVVWPRTVLGPAPLSDMRAIGHAVVSHRPPVGENRQAVMQQVGQLVNVGGKNADGTRNEHGRLRDANSLRLPQTLWDRGNDVARVAPALGSLNGLQRGLFLIDAGLGLKHST